MLFLPLGLMVVVSLVSPQATNAPGTFRGATGESGDGAGASIEAYRGLGSWIDIYDDAAWAAPRATVRTMKEHGVRTLYLETSNFNRHRPFIFRSGTEQFVDAAHDLGVHVVAWYLPGFDDLERDFERSMAAIGLVTDEGNSFDSFALDIESPEVDSPSLRTSRLLELSERIRAAAGDDYPLGAIVPSPRGVETNPDYWPGFPYAELAATYDVLLPMTYFTWRVSGPRGAHWYSAQNIAIIREETGDRSVPIHVIGGISDEATVAETRGFVRVVRERGVLGASYYGFPGTTPGQWAVLETIPATPA